MSCLSNTGETEFTSAPPRMIVEGGVVALEDVTPRTCDVAADGRFLMIQENPNRRS